MLYSEREKGRFMPLANLSYAGKNTGKKKYRPVVSFHKSDKGSDIINTCAHPPLVMLFFILISDFKRLIS